MPTRRVTAHSYRRMCTYELHRARCESEWIYCDIYFYSVQLLFLLQSIDTFYLLFICKISVIANSGAFHF